MRRELDRLVAPFGRPELAGDDARAVNAAEITKHEENQRGVIAAQRAAVIELRDRRDINDATLRTIERELDLEELRMEG